jgi:dinuclear metal center YbgI/SA1388 family protein
MFAKGQTIVQLFEQFAPKHYAVPDDKIGLQLGTLHKEVKRILIALDVVDDVADEAISEQVDLIIAHHAIIYRPLRHLQTDTPAGRLYEKLIKHDIAVYIAHTNLDVAQGGINDLMAEALGLQRLSILDEVYSDQQTKLGLGRIGTLSEPESLSQLCERVKKAFDVPMVRVVGQLSKPIRKVAVLGGSGSSFVKHALFAGADVLITGDIDYHTAHDALAAGLAIIDPGHNIEKIMKRSIADYMQEKLKKNRYSTEVMASAIHTEPFIFM